MGSDFTTGSEVPVGNVASGEKEAAILGISREFRRAQIVNRAFAHRQPFRVERRDHRRIDLVNRLDKVFQPVNKGFDVHQALKIEHAQPIEVNRVSHAANRQVLDMRAFATKQRHHAVGITLTLERLQIVRHGNQVNFRRQFHCRMSPITVGENT